MPLTSRGLYYPAAADHTRLWEHIESLATTADTAINAIDVTNDAVTAYTPSWTSGFGGPAVAIGDGTINGWYWDIGPLRYFEIQIVRGSTTNLGSTYYAFGLPSTPASMNGVFGAGEVFQGTSHRGRTVAPGAGSQVVLVDNAAAPVSSTAPGSWAAGNRIGMSGLYRR